MGNDRHFNMIKLAREVLDMHHTIGNHAMVRLCGDGIKIKCTQSGVGTH